MHRLHHPWVLSLLLAGCSSEEEPEPQPSPDPAGLPASDALSDEFDDAGTLSSWRQWHQVAGTDRPYELLDIGRTNAGMLTLQPKAGGWFGGNEGPLLYKMVEGDFVVETWVSAAKFGDPGSPPDEQFNSAGLMARDPVTGDGRDNWIMFNVGRQEGARVATEGKTTVNSQSTLELVDGPRQGRLRICRVGSTFVLARRMEGEGAFTVMHRYERSDLPEALQVGMVATGWNSAEPQPDLSRTPDITGAFDYVRFSKPEGEADCTAE